MRILFSLKQEFILTRVFLHLEMLSVHLVMRRSEKKDFMFLIEIVNLLGFYRFVSIKKLIKSSVVNKKVYM